MHNQFKSYFPIFKHQPDLVYLDNAATTQRPQPVIDTLSSFYTTGNANIHRGVYDLSNNATAGYEGARSRVAAFLGVSNPSCIAFTKGATESINAVAHGYLAPRMQPGDNVVTTILEHHANFVPWQQVTQAREGELRVVPVDERGNLKEDVLEEMLDERTRMLVLTHVSNTLGTVNDLQKIITLAHSKNVPVLVDAAQSAAFYELDHRKLKYDFLAFSGHKLFGPFGIGVLFVNRDFHRAMQPFQMGGGMIRQVEVGNTDFAKFPHLLEAGTPPVSGAIGLAAAINFLGSFDRPAARKYIAELTAECRYQLERIDKVTVLGNPTEGSGILSFTVEDIHPHDVASFLNKDGIAVRAGMHCTQPLLEAMGIPVTVRASFTLYNTSEEIERFTKSLKGLIKFWG